MDKILEMKQLKQDIMFINITNTIAETNSTCLRRFVGAILVKNGRILSTGYNGAPSGLEHCKKCLRQELKIPSGERQELCRAVHAEANAIIFAAKNGINIDGATMYVNTFPCTMCTKMIINSGIKRLVYQSEYNDKLSIEMLKESNIEIVKISK